MFLKSISVIIPNHNKAQYLSECIESVLGQSYPISEIIIVDDCSTDNSKEIIKFYSEKDSKVKYIFLSNNVGVSKARNIGYFRSTGEFITFLDADDIYWNVKKIENEMNIIEKHKDKNVIAYSMIKFIDADGNSVAEYSNVKYPSNNNFMAWLKGNNRIGLARDYCLKREVFESEGLYDEDMSFYEDLDLLLKLSLNNIFVCTEDYGTGYRQLNNGLSRRSSYEHKKIQEEIRKKYIKYLPWYKETYIVIYWKLLLVHRLLK